MDWNNLPVGLLVELDLYGIPSREREVATEDQDTGVTLVATSFRHKFEEHDYPAWIFG